MRPFYLEAKTISDAWFQLLLNLFDNSYVQDIQRGSFELEQHRLQYPGIGVYIEYPYYDIVPVIPPALGLPAPTTMEYIEEYFTNYLMDPKLGTNETYKYASRIHERIPEDINSDRPWRSQLEFIIDMLKKTPLTNQAVIEIAKPSDVTCCVGNDGKNDPPCLRLIDFKVLPVKAPIQGAGYEKQNALVEYKDVWYQLTLTVSVYFRSWDLWAGFPSNLGGIELLKQYVAEETGLVNGPMYAYSAGAHIYGYQEEIARLRTMKTKKEGV